MRHYVHHICTLAYLHISTFYSYEGYQLCRDKFCLEPNTWQKIRDVAVQGDRMRFRCNIERIGEIMAYEMSKELTYSVKQVQTPLGVAPVSTPDDEVVIATVFRAGLPLHTGFLNMFDHAGNAFVSAYRYYKDKECRTVDVHIEYIATPDFVQEDIIDCRPDACHGRKVWNWPGRPSSPRGCRPSCR